MSEALGRLETPVGTVWIRWRASGVTRLAFEAPESPAQGLSEVPDWIRVPLAEYFAGRCPVPRVAVAPVGTAFQRRVWQALTDVPPGRPVTYGALAARLGTSARAVGNACAANPVPLFIPCHRVVPVRGVGGYAGHREGRYPAIKRWLLVHEQRFPAGS